MKPAYFLLAAASVAIASFSQILLKKGAARAYASRIREYVNGFVLAGYGLLLVSMALTLLAYRHLSYLSIPVVEALGYVLVPVLSFFFFGEELSKKKVGGILLILAGIAVYYS